MSMRRTLQALTVAAALGGAVAPLYTSQAQQDPAGRPATTTTVDDRDDGVDFGWIGILGLVGLAGLFGNRRDERALGRTATATRTP